MINFMPNLWDVFVVSIFGGFWLSVVGLVVIFGLILMMGGVSPFSIMIFCLLFVMSMSMGYGMALFTIFIWVTIVFWSIYQIVKFIGST